MRERVEGLHSWRLPLATNTGDFDQVWSGPSLSQDWSSGNLSVIRKLLLPAGQLQFIIRHVSIGTLFLESKLTQSKGDSAKQIQGCQVFNPAFSYSQAKVKRPGPCYKDRMHFTFSIRG